MYILHLYAACLHVRSIFLHCLHSIVKRVRFTFYNFIQCAEQMDCVVTIYKLKEPMHEVNKLNHPLLTLQLQSYT